MNKEIKYAGFTAVPSDYESQDGDLAVAINIIPENGALRPVHPPKLIKNISGGGKVTFIHKPAGTENYILYNPESNEISSLGVNSKSNSSPIPIATLANVSHFDAVGNTLLAFTPTSIQYFLWKDGSYQSLGTHIPEVDISFGLIGRPRLFSQCDESKSPFKIQFDNITQDEIHNEFSESNKTRITEQVMAKVNKFVREQTIEKGRFCFPFFVRYALRLYDGSLVNHSAPILMNPSTTDCPVVIWNRIISDTIMPNPGHFEDVYDEAELDIMMVASTLDYQILNSEDVLDEAFLKNWSDIVTGIEIFISKPIYTFDQNGLCTSWYDTDNMRTKFIGRLYADNPDSVSNEIAEDKLLGEFTNKNFLNVYAEWEYYHIYRMYFSSDRKYPGETLHLPEISPDKLSETLQSTSTFYKLHTIEFSKVYDLKKSSERHEIVVPDDYLQSLLTREVMTDDYHSHDLLAAEKSYNYNNRLNLSGISRKPFRGFRPQSMFAYCTRTLSFSTNPSSPKTLNVGLDMSSDTISADVYIEVGGSGYWVSADNYSTTFLSRFLSDDLTDGSKRKKSWGCYLFYPNVNAKKIVINTLYGSILIPLKPHDFLNGAYALLDYDAERIETDPKDLSSIPGGYNPDPLAGYIKEENKIYTSEVNNPFYFPLLGVNTIGSGKMLGICSAAKALSQGQFGQFPLYAFTTEGVWALEVSSTGTYSARQPITRDVCINSEGITQLDSAVLFPTNRGIMLISGSQTQCISEAINSEYPFNALSLPHFDTLHEMLGHNPTNDKCLPTLPFTKFLEKCRMIYDYVHQRVIVYAPEITYAYVYSLKSQMWAMIYSDIASHLNSYPESLAVDNSGAVVSYSEIPIDEASGVPLPVKALYVTRPLKLDAVNILKTVSNIIQRGDFRRGHVTSVLWASRDLINWQIVWTSRDHYLRGFSGTPYKYFRLGGVATLDPDESIFGASIQFLPRLTNQPR